MNYLEILIERGAGGITIKTKSKGTDSALSPAILIALNLIECVPGVNAGIGTEQNRVGAVPVHTTPVSITPVVAPSV